MAGTKNDPKNRGANAKLQTRVCEICGNEGELGVVVHRVKRKRTMMWLCKDMTNCR